MEKFLVTKKACQPNYKYMPKTKEELIEIIGERFATDGQKCNLNDIDVSEISDMSYLFSPYLWAQKCGGILKREEVCIGSNSKIPLGLRFNGDISYWNVSNVTNMEGMFLNSNFNGDISCWDVSNVTNMERMFLNSDFNGDISCWDVSNVTNMNRMFMGSDFDGDLSRWDVSKVSDKEDIFFDCPLSAKLPGWRY